MVEEIKRLNVFDVCISHNPKMTKWLLDNGLKRGVGKKKNKKPLFLN